MFLFASDICVFSCSDVDEGNLYLSSLKVVVLSTDTGADVDMGGDAFSLDRTSYAFTIATNDVNLAEIPIAIQTSTYSASTQGVQVSMRNETCLPSTTTEMLEPGSSPAHTTPVTWTLLAGTRLVYEFMLHCECTCCYMEQL